MSHIPHDALDVLRKLGSPAELRALAAKGLAPAQAPRVNAHVHLPPNFSAFTTVQQAVDLAADQKVGVLGASNYYDFRIYGPFAAECRRHGIFPLYGLEIIALIDDLVRAGVKINDPGNPGKMYLCGKGITRFAEMTPEARRLVEGIRRNDTERMARMTEKLAQIFAARGVQTGLTALAVIDRVVKRHSCPREAVCLQERHLAQAFQEVFFDRVKAEDRPRLLGEIFGAPTKAGPQDGVKVQNEIRSHLMKAGKAGFVPETFVNFEQAYRLILDLGGIPCYPTLADGTSPICAFEEPAEKLIGELQARGVYCAELVPIRNKPDVLLRYVTAMRRAGLVVVGGTEHNTLDLLPMEPTCLAGAPVPQEVKDIFWEGACVIAAHQFLSLHGECGFVDGEGRKNPAYASDEERLAAMSRLGAAVIEKYYVAWASRP
jgi:hypothetical protein